MAGLVLQEALRNPLAAPELLRNVFGVHARLVPDRGEKLLAYGRPVQTAGPVPAAEP